MTDTQPGRVRGPRFRVVLAVIVAGWVIEFLAMACGLVTL